MSLQQFYKVVADHSVVVVVDQTGKVIVRGQTPVDVVMECLRAPRADHLALVQRSLALDRFAQVAFQPVAYSRGGEGQQTGHGPLHGSGSILSKLRFRDTSAIFVENLKGTTFGNQRSVVPLLQHSDSVADRWFLRHDLRCQNLACRNLRCQNIFQRNGAHDYPTPLAHFPKSSQEHLSQLRISQVAPHECLEYEKISRRTRKLVEELESGEVAPHQYLLRLTPHLLNFRALVE